MTDFNAARARAKRPCPLWVDAFQRDTQHLEADEVGAYMLILMAMWTRESCDFPHDETRLARVSRVSSRLWKSRIGVVLMPFFSVEDGAVLSKRLRKEAAYTERQVKQQSDRKSGEKPAKPLENKPRAQSADDTTDEPRDHPTQLPNYPTELSKKEDTNVSLQVSPAGDVSEAVRIYNDAASQAGWPSVQKLTPARSRSLKARVSDAGGMDGWRFAIERAAKSDFLSGRTDKPWTGFGFDWLTKAANFTKLMEGNYDNRSATNPTGNQTGGRGPHHSLMAGFAAVANRN